MVEVLSILTEDKPQGKVSFEVKTRDSGELKILSFLDEPGPYHEDDGSLNSDKIVQKAFEANGLKGRSFRYI